MSALSMSAAVCFSVHVNVYPSISRTHAASGQPNIPERGTWDTEFSTLPDDRSRLPWAFRLRARALRDEPGLIKVLSFWAPARIDT